MKLIPLHLRALANVAAKDGNSRFGATTGIQLECRETEYVASATDSRRLIQVTGSYVDHPDNYPAIPALASAQNSATSSVIDAGTFKALSMKADKLTKRGCNKPALRSLAIVQGETETTFAATNLESTMVESCRNVDGRFPNVSHVIPDARNAEYRVKVDPRLFAELLESIDALTNDETHAVTLEFQSDKPITVKTSDANCRVLGLLVPLSAGETNYGKNPPLRNTGNGSVIDHRRQFRRLLDALRKIQGTREAGGNRKVAEKIESLENRRAELIQENSRLAEEVKALKEKLDLIGEYGQRVVEESCYSVH